ncbi:hypothetical protein ACFYYM_35900 [Streptomyces erythrochromogenes]|uniref:hypothetical protein n=1 Tax=Streptomyces erythrochromogenes TaxID=285574 RepID=UPI0036AAF831
MPGLLSVRGTAGSAGAGWPRAAPVGVVVERERAAAAGTRGRAAAGAPGLTRAHLRPSAGMAGERPRRGP